MLYDDDGKPSDWVFLDVNPAFEKNSGLHEATGKTIREMTPNIEDKWFDIYGDVARNGKPRRFIEQSDALNRWFDLYAFRVGDPEERKVAVLFKDITHRKREEGNERFMADITDDLTG
jgi:PAS domain-containing protein